ncbi:cupin domain-containing protein [Hazenella coriacea]|uniref:AraC-like protein n=1 Tax=Hazenella coriacea TaxID=1179467 RepID=A0A4R3L3L3_9BACL|nr:hypothetical protein [Hazenella coriacea]TCS93240.1 hypothetical protein EDD58_10854 [Hazenella coriacea]
MKTITTKNQLDLKAKHIERILQLENAEVMNLQLKTGEKIPEHHAKENLLVIVRRGKLLFQVENETTELTNEILLYMNPLEKHQLEAIEDTDIIIIKIQA